MQAVPANGYNQSKMKRYYVLLLIVILFVGACSGQSFPLPHDSRPEEPPASTANSDAETAVANPTTPAEPIPDAGGYARAFYRAWEGQDYIGMYSLLSQQSQAKVGSEAFVSSYQDAMDTARVKTIHAQPLSLVQEDDQAEFGVRVTWDTAVTGQITRDYSVPLTYKDGRWGIEWHEGLILPELEGGNRLSMEYEIPSRANIYDINGQALAYQGKVVSLSVIPGQIQDEPYFLGVLSQVLGKPAEDIQFLYAASKPDWLVPIGDITEARLQDFALDIQPLIGAGLAPPEGRTTRIYDPDGVAPHIVGYTGFIPAEQISYYLEEGYRGDEQVGLVGMEGWGEEYLNGTRGGTLSVYTSNGEFVSTLADQQPKQSRSLFTTFDKSFQAAVEQALAEAISSHPTAEHGAVVVLDVNNGKVKAMASYPSYNPQIFDGARPNADVELGQVFNDPGRPLINRAAQGAYPAGSVFKIVTLAAALNSGLYTPETLYTSTGTWNKLGDGNAKTDWLEGGHGTITLKQALVVSCNSCFYDVGYNIDGQDNTLLPRIATEFGLGQRTGISGIDETSGLIPSPEWKTAELGEGWATGDAVNMAIGQGYVQVTPLQIANMVAAVANGGTLYQPTLVDRIGAAGDAPEEPWPVQTIGQLPLDPDQMATLKDALWNVANGPWGTASDRFDGLPLQVAGKTGTAEAPPNDPHAWFAGYAPAAPYTTQDGTYLEDPEIAISVIVENAGEGSAVAAPIFRRIVELYYGIPTTPFPWQT